MSRLKAVLLLLDIVFGFSLLGTLQAMYLQKYATFQQQKVTLKIYNIFGKGIVTLVNENQKPGTYKVTWNTDNQPSGIYFNRIVAGSFTKTKRMILLK